MIPLLTFIGTQIFSLFYTRHQIYREKFELLLSEVLDARERNAKWFTILKGRNNFRSDEEKLTFQSDLISQSHKLRVYSTLYFPELKYEIDQYCKNLLNMMKAVASNSTDPSPIRLSNDRSAILKKIEAVLLKDQERLTRDPLFYLKAFLG